METGNLAFALVRDGVELARGTRDGIAELLAATDALGTQAAGASLADKVVGKAVALVAAHRGIGAIDTPLASEAAARFLKGRGLALRATAVVPVILNRRGDGPCPLEALTGPLEEPATAVTKLREFLAARRPPPPAAAP